MGTASNGARRAVAAAAWGCAAGALVGCAGLLGDFDVSAADDGGIDAGSDVAGNVDGCAPGLSVCGGACVDEQTNDQSCGGCGAAFACTSGMRCDAGRCACPASTLLCGGACTTCKTPPNADPTCQGATCTYACKTGYTQCGGACVDLETTPTDCGACGHDCLGGACALGACQPVTVASSQPGAAGIAVDATTLYWTSAGAGTVMKQPIAGGAAVTVADHQGDPEGIAIDATSVYWIAVGDGAVRKAPLVGGNVVGLVSASGLAGGPSQVAVSGGQIFYVQYSVLYRFPVTSAGIASSVTAHPNTVEAVTGDGTNVYFSYTNPQTQGGPPAAAIVSEPILGGTAVQLAAGTATGSPPVYARGIAVDHSQIVWTATDGTVMKAPLVGDGKASVIAAGQKSPFSIVIDGADVVWTDDGPGGGVFRAPLAGGVAPVRLASGTSAWGIAVDAKSVYWTDKGAGAVMKIAK